MGGWRGGGGRGGEGRRSQLTLICTGRAWLGELLTTGEAVTTVLAEVTRLVAMTI